MPSQEEKLKMRIQTVLAMIKDAGTISLKELEAWALIYLGIRERTLGRYVMALDQMGVVSFDPKNRVIKWGETVE